MSFSMSAMAKLPTVFRKILWKMKLGTVIFLNSRMKELLPTFELGKRHQRSLLHWDGKESELSMSQCDVSDSRAAKGWKLVADEQLDSGAPDEEIFRVAENLVLENAQS
jgi:hypothetical protein